jgi:hypothetical protein
MVTAWQRDNPEKARAKRESWAAANPEKARAKSAKWAKRNPEKVFVLRLRRRAARRGATLSHQVEAEIHDWHRIVMADPCPYTRQRVGCDHMDHIVPVAVGGEDTWWNLIGASASANRRKSNRSLLHFLLDELTPSTNNEDRTASTAGPRTTQRS